MTIPLDERFSKYRELKDKYQATILADKAAKVELRKIHENMKKENQSSAKLSAVFNAKKLGFNELIKEKIDREINSNVIDFPLSLKFCKRLKKHMKNTGEADEIEKQLSQIEQEVLVSYMPLALSVAKKFSSNIFNIDINDSIQEANKGILEAIEKFDPNRRNKFGEKAKFSTYAYVFASKKIKDWIMNQSRLVRIPRNKLKVIFMVLEITANNPTKEASILVREANKILEKRKGRKLQSNEFLNEEDIIEAISLLNGNSISIDKKNTFTYEESSRPKTIGDFLQSEEKNPEEILVQKDGRDILVQKLEGNLTVLECFIIKSKFLGRQDKSLKEIQSELLEDTGKKLSRERINQIKKEALLKLSRIPMLKELLKESL